jgi:hypothetical protein
LNRISDSSVLCRPSSSAFFRGLHTTSFSTWGFSKSPGGPGSFLDGHRKIPARSRNADRTSICLRDDFDQLPFYSQLKTALAESFTAEPEAQANWTALYQQMSLSPDLALPQADTLADECYAQMENDAASA